MIAFADRDTDTDMGAGRTRRWVLSLLLLLRCGERDEEGSEGEVGIL